MCFINAAQSDESQNHRGYSRYINNPYMQPMGFPFNAPKPNYPENESIENVDYDVNQICEGFPFEFIQALQQKNQQYQIPQNTAQQQQQYFFQEQQPAQQQQQYFAYQPLYQEPQQQQYQQVDPFPYYAEKPSFVTALSAQVPENEIYQVLGPLEADSQEDEESCYMNENNKFYFSQFQPSAVPQLEKYEDNEIQQGYAMPPAAYTEQSQLPQNATFFNEPPVYSYAPYTTIPANIPMVAAEIPQLENNNNINFYNQNLDFDLQQVQEAYGSMSEYYDAQRDGQVKYENCSETADCMVSNNHRMEPNSPSNELSQATNVQDNEKQQQEEEVLPISKDNELEEHDPNEPEILGRIRNSNKKNVVKNIMSAFKRFIQELDSENNEKLSDAHSAAVASKIQNLKQNHISASEGFHIDVPVERERVLSLYNESKVKPDSIEEMSKKFKRYIASKQFNHYTIRLLVQHANYGSIFRYFLDNHAQNWLSQSKVDDPNGHKVMIEFLQAACEDIGIIEKLKKHEKRKAIYQ